MGIGQLSLPFSDADLTGAQDIIFEVNGGGNLTATVDLPQATGGLDYGYYNYRDVDTTRSDSLAKAVAAALTAADTETWTHEEAATAGMPGRVRLLRGGTTATVNLKFGDASTTFDGRWLGFLQSTYISASSAVTSSYPAGRLFLPPQASWAPSRPQRRVTVATTMAGRTEYRSIATGPSRYRLRFPALPLARVYSWAYDQADWVAAVDGMLSGDFNTALEALWDWLPLRAPLRYHPDYTAAGTFVELSLVDIDKINDFTLIAGDPHEDTTRAVVMMADLDCVEYVT